MSNPSYGDTVNENCSKNANSIVGANSVPLADRRTVSPSPVARPSAPSMFAPDTTIDDEHAKADTVLLNS